MVLREHIDDEEDLRDYLFELVGRILKEEMTIADAEREALAAIEAYVEKEKQESWNGGVEEGRSEAKRDDLPIRSFLAKYGREDKPSAS